MTGERQIVKRSPPALFYKQRDYAPDGRQRDSLHLAIVGAEPAFCRDLVLAAYLFTSFGPNGRVKWRPEVPAVLMPGADVQLLGWREIAKSFRGSSEPSVKNALVLISLSHGVEDPQQEVEFIAWCDVRDEAITFEVREDLAGDRDVLELKAWLSGS